MRFYLDTALPAGIPTWFIARSHRFSTRVHWRYGALFSDTSNKHLALVRAFPYRRFLDLKVRGPFPYNFFVLLKDGLELTLSRFPGLQIKRTIPCPGHGEEPCDHEFLYQHLSSAVERAETAPHIQCPVTFSNVSIATLLFGIHMRTTQDALLDKMKQIEKMLIQNSKRIDEYQEISKSEGAELREFVQRNFSSIFSSQQSNVDTHCPNTFVIRPRGTRRFHKRIEGRSFELQLYCQAPGEWHPTDSSGCYEIRDLAKWLRVIAPFLKPLVAGIKVATPIIGPWLAWYDNELDTILKEDIRLMHVLVQRLPEIIPLEKNSALENTPNISQIHGPELRAFRRMLDQVDIHQVWGNLQKVVTPEGHHLWLCGHHALKYRRKLS